MIFMASSVNVGAAEYAFGLFIEPLEETFGWSRTQISTALSFAAVASLMAPITGRLMDRYGARPVMTTSLTVIGLSYLLRPMMTELWQWYALSIVQYLGFTGATGLPAGRLIGLWFRRTRGRVMGFTMMGNNFGGLVLPPVVGLVLVATSWQTGYLVVSAVTLTVALLAFILVRDETPDDQGEQSTGRSGAGRATDIKGLTLKQALTNRAFYILALTFSLARFSRITVIPQLIAHLTNEGMSVASATLALSVFAAFGMMGKITFGFLSEKITARYAYVVSLSGQAIFMTMIGLAGGSIFAWIAVALFGLCMGGMGALSQLIVQDIFGIRFFGSIRGTLNMTTVASAAVGPMLAGMIFDITGSYSMAFFLVSGFLVVSALTITQARSPEESKGEMV